MRKLATALLALTLTDLGRSCLDSPAESESETALEVWHFEAFQDSTFAARRLTFPSFPAPASTAVLQSVTGRPLTAEARDPSPSPCTWAFATVFSGTLAIHQLWQRSVPPDRQTILSQRNAILLGTACGGDNEFAGLDPDGLKTIAESQCLGYSDQARCQSAAREAFGAESLRLLLNDWDICFSGDMCVLPATTSPLAYEEQIWVSADASSIRARVWTGDVESSAETMRIAPDAVPEVGAIVSQLCAEVRHPDSDFRGFDVLAQAVVWNRILLNYMLGLRIDLAAPVGDVESFLTTTGGGGWRCQSGHGS